MHLICCISLLNHPYHIATLAIYNEIYNTQVTFSTPAINIIYNQQMPSHYVCISADGHPIIWSPVIIDREISATKAHNN